MATSGHTLASLLASTAGGTHTAEVRILDFDAGFAEKNPNGSFLKSVLHTHFASQLQHRVIRRSHLPVLVNPEHPSGLIVKWRQFRLPVGDMSPLRTSVELLSGKIKCLRVNEGSASHSGARQDEGVSHQRHSKNTEAAQPRSEQEGTKMPRVLWKILVTESTAGLEDGDTISLLGQS